jgi:hypothetical protein
MDVSLRARRTGCVAVVLLIQQYLIVRLNDNRLQNLGLYFKKNITQANGDEINILGV